MKLERVLAQKFLYTEEGKLRPAVKVSTLGISLGVAVILLSLFVVDGFKQEIEQKINGFVGTIRISNPDNTYDSYTIPLAISPDLLSEIEERSQSLSTQASVTTFIDQMALIKVDSAFRAVMMHGVGTGYDSLFYAKYLIDGHLPNMNGNGEVLLSHKISQHLGLGVGDQFMAYYRFGESVKMRKYEVVGLLNTGFDAYDDHLVLISLSDLQSVNDWATDEVGGITVTLPSRKYARELYESLFDLLADRHERHGERYAMFTVEELNYNYFGWLDLLDANVLLILILMIAVAAMTIITGVVVMILEKVRAIATLKAMGQRDRSLQQIFWLMSSSILLRGMAVGNLIALGIGMLQKQFKLVTLDPSQYYMSYVPVSIDWAVLLWTNVAVFAVVFIFVLLPTRIISSINPARTLRFE